MISSFLELGKFVISLIIIFLKLDLAGSKIVPFWNNMTTAANLVILSSLGFIATILL